MESEKKEVEDTDKITLDSLLNILDGTLEIPNRMLVLSTNHAEVIDDALIRPGRIDMIIDFKYANKTIVKEMFEGFYSRTFETDKFAKIIDYKVSPAFINQYMFKNMTNPDKAIEEIKELSLKKGKYIKHPPSVDKIKKSNPL